jgi:ribosomal protein L37AE/L43A
MARVGGAGGSSSSSGSGGGIGELIFYIFLLIPTPYNFITVGIIIILYLIFKKRLKQRSIFNKIPNTATPNAQNQGLEKYKAANPHFDESKFKTKVHTAFTQIQQAWAEKDLANIRRYISDGMYQRLNTQIKMMDLLDQRNELSKIDIKGIYIDKVLQEGNFDVIHVAIHAGISDKFISGKYKNLNSGGYEEFVEYWSFIQKQGIESKDMYSVLSCLNCGAELPTKAGEISKCEHCGTLTNSGAYDWILTEITQADDYITSTPLNDLSHNLNERISEIAHDNEDFSTQIIEDKVSNGYLQIETARVYKKPEMMRRFVSDDVYNTLSLQFETDPKFVYNRIFLSDVTVIGALQQGEKNVLAISVKSAFQRVSINENKLTIIDPQIVTQTKVVLFSRDIKANINKGSLYAHQCPSCGAPIGDTTDMNCGYCGALLNSTENEWIITGILSLNEYMEFFKTNAQAFLAKLNPDKINQMYKIRDYAFNNVLIMIAVDGVFDVEEIDFANSLARKWGYNTTKVQGLIDMARNNKLVLRMPESQKERQKIYNLMEKAAKIDNKVVDAEQSLLDHVKKEYLN